MKTTYPLLVMLLLCGVGCNKSDATKHTAANAPMEAVENGSKKLNDSAPDIPNDDASSDTVSERDVDANHDANDDAVAESATETGSPPTSPSTSSSTSKEESQPNAVSEAEDPGVAMDAETDRLRLLLFTPGGPLLIDVIAQVNGRPLEEVMGNYLKDVLRVADSNEDGEVTWDEALENDAIRYGQFGNMALQTSAAVREARRQYDVDSDGIVDASELPRFLTNNAGTTRPFTLTAVAGSGGDEQARSPLRRLLDVDEDGVLSDAEIDQATTRVRVRDADDDEVVFAADLSGQTTNPLANAPSRAKRYGARAGEVLDKEVDIVALHYTLSEKYAYGGKIEAGNFAAVPQLFAALDGDHNGVLVAEELGALHGVPAHMVVELRFGATGPPESASVVAEGQSTGDDQNTDDEENSVEGENGRGQVVQPPATAPMRLVSLGLDLSDQQDALQLKPRSLEIRLPGFSMQCAMEDNTTNNQRAAAMALLTQFDGDQNGYLDEEEFPDMENGPFMVPFRLIDVDGNQQLPVNEIERYLLQRNGATLNQIRGVTGERDDPLFSAIDLNADGRLTSRELMRLGELLRRLDSNGDGRVTNSEIPGSMYLNFVRGVSQPNVDVDEPMPVATPSTDAPPWFARMDSNQDGEISRLEFLGSPGLFDELDKDGDGFLVLGEAPRS